MENVFRCPTHAPWDFEFWEAIDLPEGMSSEGIPLNAVILSAHGYVNSIMADGDLDGDLNMLLFSGRLNDFMEYTQADVDKLNRISYENDVKQRLVDDVKQRLADGVDEVTVKPTVFSGTTDRDLTAAEELIDFTAGQCTLDIRGKAARMSSRATFQIVESLEANKIVDLTFPLLFVVICHLAFDVPKKLARAQVFNVLGKLRAEAKLKTNARTMVNYIDEKLYFRFEGLSKRRIAEYVAPYLDSHLKGAIGRVWLPLKEIHLAYDAGVLIGKAILSTPLHERYYERDLTTFPIKEIASVASQALG